MAMNSYNLPVVVLHSRRDACNITNRNKQEGTISLDVLVYAPGTNTICRLCCTGLSSGLSQPHGTETMHACLDEYQTLFHIVVSIVPIQQPRRRKITNRTCHVSSTQPSTSTPLPTPLLLPMPSRYLKANQLNMLLHPTHIRDKKEKIEKCTQAISIPSPIAFNPSPSSPSFSFHFHSPGYSLSQIQKRRR